MTSEQPELPAPKPDEPSKRIARYVITLTDDEFRHLSRRVNHLTEKLVQRGGKHIEVIIQREAMK